jgi:DNA-directed RNA polymerase specialized sigma24 family protein
MILKKKTPISYDFDATFMANVKDAKVKLAKLFSSKFRSTQEVEDASQDAYLRLKDRFLNNPVDFQVKTKSKAQWTAYFVNAALNLTLNEMGKAINRIMKPCDLDELAENPATRSFAGLRSEQNFNFVSDADVYERKLALIEKAIASEENELKRQVLTAWFIEGLDQRTITAKYGVVGGSISSYVSRFSQRMKSFLIFVDTDALVDNDEVSIEELMDDANTTAEQEPKLPNKKQQAKADQTTVNLSQPKVETRGRKKKNP